MNSLIHHSSPSCFLYILSTCFMPEDKYIQYTSTLHMCKNTITFKRGNTKMAALYYPASIVSLSTCQLPNVKTLKRPKFAPLSYEASLILTFLFLLQPTARTSWPRPCPRDCGAPTTTTTAGSTPTSGTTTPASARARSATSTWAGRPVSSGQCLTSWPPPASSSLSTQARVKGSC